MTTITATEIILATAAEAFDFIADYRNIPRIQPHFTSARLVSEQETGLGAEIELTGKFHGVPMRAQSRVVTYAPPFRHVSISEGTVRSRSTWQFEQITADPPATRVTFILDYKLGGPLGGILPGLGSALTSVFERELRGLTAESLRLLKEAFAEKS